MPSHPIGPTKPTIGRIVHYQPEPHINEGQPAPALVTAVGPNEVALTVFWPDDEPDWGIRAQHVEPQPGQPAPGGTWHWPAIR